MLFNLIRVTVSAAFLSGGLISLFLVARLWWKIVGAFIDSAFLKSVGTAVLFAVCMPIVGLPIDYLFVIGFSVLPNGGHH